MLQIKLPTFYLANRSNPSALSKNGILFLRSPPLPFGLSPIMGGGAGIEPALKGFIFAFKVAASIPKK